MTRSRETTAVVLAGGQSSRFGDGLKATATLGGSALVERVAEAVRDATGRDPIVAAGGNEKRPVVEGVLSDAVQYVEDAEWCAGPLAGVCGAVPEVTTPTLFLCGCDMPLLSARAVSWLCDRHADTDADVTVPLDEDGHPQLLHAVYETAALEAYCDRRPDSHSLRSLVSELSVETVPPEATPGDIGVLQSAVNVNTRSELVAARQRRATGEYVRR
ncbi:molybdopterin-guanine dinucleotide biosynthesis protein MobA [Haloferax elongans ATCC BAA-1513]|uniref:Molybdopterin-guanine dinucleotide biosynthesis protein MobA n=1 Tax=Haloferax elongans ATCC BAA-1513 TaxID=1230453 RepID=M0HLD8_HALEO|nr:molybdenum cofactor guanylyltransferase [Haloferax elongans]ELZ84603.1 molybdopterin-guanine dinucleotide biosynthesis protein MobA [Haloferax elongans ATCC BAA-1513]